MNLNEKINSNLLWIATGFLYILVIVTSVFIKSPEEITTLLSSIVDQLKLYSLFVHFLFILVLAAIIINKEQRNKIILLFLLFLTISALVTSIVFLLLPNIILFSLVLFGLILTYQNEDYNFHIHRKLTPDLIFGIIGIIFGFWYLHWVEEPILFNALFFSPIGLVNCPTLLTICAFLILTKNPQPYYLSVVVSSFTIFYGFFGILFLNALIDIVLVICGMYLLLRSFLNREKGITKKLSKI